jgi:hypothetical protein
MTTAADDSAVEDAFEAILAGRPVPEGAAGLAAFAGAVRASATQAGRPNAALAELLATGLLTDQSSPSVRTARSAGSAPVRRPSRVRNRRRFAMIFPVLVAKFLSAGAVAQAAAGAGIVVVAVTGAGAVGVLPDPLQNTVATAVETVTPFDLEGGEVAPEDEAVVDESPTEEEPAAEEPAAEEPATEEPATEEPATEEPATEEPAVEIPVEDSAFSAEAWALEGPDAYPSFGAWVSEGARHGAAKDLGVRFGELVSSRARQKGLDAEELEAEGVDLDELTDATTEPATAGEVEVTETKVQKAEPQVGTTHRGNGTPAGSNGTPAGSNGTPADSNGTPADSNGTGAGNGTPAGSNGKVADSNGTGPGNAAGNGNGNGNGNGAGGKGNGRN